MIRRGAPRIFISAGEPSGDLHGAGVVRALRARYPRATIEALGGPRMEQAGATLRYRMEGLAAFGLVEVVTKIRAHYRLLRALRNDFKVGRYDLVILVDYPGFHLRVAEAAHADRAPRSSTTSRRSSGPGGPGRARRLAAAVDRLAVVLPFEQMFFGGLGLRSEYVGHPLVDRGPGRRATQARAQARVSPIQSRAGHLSRKSGAGDPASVGAVSGCRVEAAERGYLRPGPGGGNPRRPSTPIPDRSRCCAEIRCRSLPRPTRHWPNRGPPRWRRHWRTPPWSWPTRSTPSPRPCFNGFEP